jgi:hypothetical protein
MTYMALYIILLMQANPLRRQVGGGGSWKSRLFWAFEMASSPQANAIWGPKQSQFPGPNALPLAQVSVRLHQKHYVQDRINQGSTGSFMYMSLQGPKLDFGGL